MLEASTPTWELEAHDGPALGEDGHRYRRIGEPDDIAGAALFLASYVNGESLVVDGGYTYTG